MRRSGNTLKFFSLLLCSALTSPVVLAAPVATVSSPQLQAIHSLQKLETTSYKAVTAFYLYSVLNRDPKEQKKMQAQISAGEAMVQSLDNKNITPKWSDLKRTLTNAKFTADGPDTNSINDIDAALHTMAQTTRALETEQKVEGKIVSDKMADLLYDQYVLMETMTAAYLRKSADAYGGAVVGSQGPVVEIDQLADKFSLQLEQLNRHYAKTPKVASQLKVITTKWTFIKASFKNYNQNNVPFIVGRYNEQITEKLLEAHSALQ